MKSYKAYWAENADDSLDGAGQFQATSPEAAANEAMRELGLSGGNRVLVADDYGAWLFEVGALTLIAGRRL